MRIYAIDDEPKMLRMLHDAIAEAEPSAEILDFSRAPEVMDALTDPEKKPDVVFSDINLPGMSGLALAVKIKAAAPLARLVFVTGYDQYARGSGGDSGRAGSDAGGAGACGPSAVRTLFRPLRGVLAGKTTPVSAAQDQGAVRVSGGPPGRNLQRRRDRRGPLGG